MGLFTKSIIVLAVALSTPLLYRQFANENTVKFMSSHYSNFKTIDSFLRTSAQHLDQAKDYIPNSGQVKGAMNKIHEQVNSIIETVSSKQKAAAENKSADQRDDKATPTTTSAPIKASQVEEKIRYCQCPDDDHQNQKVRLWSAAELAKYSGEQPLDGKIYLGFMGIVYDVSASVQHYSAGSEYNVFTGRDATRAFVTGNFTHDLTDNIIDMDGDAFSQLENWSSFYQSHYPTVGRIEGAFFDAKGCATPELMRVYQAFDTLEQQQADTKEQEKHLPECNSEYNADLKKSKFWCSTKSGGIERDWVGVPRVYTNGDVQRCACVNLDAPGEDMSKLKLYPGCDAKASECHLEL